MRDAKWPAGAYAAEFADERTFAGALAILRERGYSRIETYSPYPVDRTFAAIPEPPSLLPPAVLFAGLGGGAIAYWIQWYTNAVSYPLDIGGRPTHAVPAFFIPTFEGTVLAAACMAFFGLFLLLRLPRPWHPMFEVDGFERAMIDRYWIAIDASDHRADRELTPRELAGLAPLRVERVGATA
ncbi:MAG TPA: DUF3341 domain-containing protein [Gemmatimonadaceae bacterium]|nr:DUF3341 domain-containing protein [Gemmatimonadaceae bacterium]